mmetsp:Transcript_16485/g.26446  ORF Transcript_16485/g.26446 Transcript_16485/m.26446 type:complete len:433 (+) Transcript_16485:3-1301(+)
MAKIAKNKTKRPRADKHKGKKHNQRALDRSGDGTLKQGDGKRARKSQPWKKGTNAKVDTESILGDDATAAEPTDLFSSLATAPTAHPPPSKSKEEQISEALAGKIRKRDEETEDLKSGVVPNKDLVEITDARLQSRILYCNPVCLLTTVVPRSVREKASAVGKDKEVVDVSASMDGLTEEVKQEEKEPLKGKKASPAGKKGVSPKGKKGEEVKEELATTGNDKGLIQLAEGGSSRNVMVLSWLTPTNNEGAFICALHKRRFSADCLAARGHFALNIPVQGMEALVLKVGDVTGKISDKFKLIDGLKFVELGTFTEKTDKKRRQSGEANAKKAKSSAAANSFAALEEESAGALQERALAGDEAGISGCVAQLECRVVKMTDADDGKHHLVSAQIMRAWVHPNYWNEKHFIPNNAKLPALMSFIGASRFAYIKG